MITSITAVINYDTIVEVLDKTMSEVCKETMDDGSVDESSPLDSLQQIKLDAFICGLCNITCNQFGDFLQHKLSHDSWNGIYFCLFCKIQEHSQVSIHHHYFYSHNIQTLPSEISIDNQHDTPSLFSKPPRGPHKNLDEDEANRHEGDAEADSERIILECESEGIFTASGSKVSSLNCPEQRINTQDIQVCSKVNHSELGHSTTQPIPDEGSKYEVMENISRIGDNVLVRNDKTFAEGCRDDTSQKFALYSQIGVSKDVKNVQPSVDCSCKSSQSNLLPKRNPVLSPATLSQIKRFASTAVASSSSTTGDGSRKVIIICSQDLNKKSRRNETQCTQSHVREMIHLESQGGLSNQKEGDITLEELAQQFPSITDTAVDVTKYEQDFLLQIGMKESLGKNIKYLREVYICLYCEAFEKYCLDRLIVHMMESHPSEITDRCPSRKMEGVRIKTISGVTEPGITSFQEYRSKLLDQKRKDKERRSRRVKEKGQTGGAVISFPCIYCSKRFATHRKLEAHMDKHLNVKRFLCEECGRSFRSWHLLWSHKKDHLNASYGKIKCSLCSFQSGDTQALNKHYRIHPKQSHLCHICGNMYSSLRKHVKVHSLDRPYPCPFKGCTFRFTSEVPCKIHYQAHTAQGQRFACSKCNNRFPRKHHLLRHQVKVHGDSIDAQETNNCNGSFAESLGSSLVETFQVEETAANVVVEEFHVVDQHHLDLVEELHS